MSVSRIIDTLLRPIERFFRVEAASSIILIAAAVSALAVANSVWSDDYVILARRLRPWVNDGAMTFFFFVVGLEIRRELREGVLADLRRATLPIVAAVGGMLAPALLYLATTSGADARRGWGIPMATDIAFAVGVLMLLGKRVPVGLRVLLLALAVIDDIGALLVIAFFYAKGAHGVGVHPTLIAVILGLLVPKKAGARAEEVLHPWVALGVMPLFAFTNAGVRLDGSSFTQPGVMSGVALGLIVGKPLGVMLASYAAVKLRLCRLPSDVGWRDIFVMGCLAGVGFTMSIFISELAFAGTAMLMSAKAAVLGASVVAAGLGFATGRVLLRPGAARLQ